MDSLCVLPSRVDKVITFDLNREKAAHLIPTHFDGSSICSISPIFMTEARRTRAHLSSLYRADQSSWRLLAWEGSGLLLYDITMSRVICDLLASLDPA